MTDKQGYNPSFHKYFGKRVLFHISDEMKVGGRVVHVDQFMNVVLANAFEFKQKEGTQVPLNTTIIRGSNIVFWEFLEKEETEGKAAAP